MITKKILIMAGGTGGHVFPALAVARAMQAQGIEIHWLGTLRGLENDLIPKANIPLYCIPISGWRGKGWKKWLVAPFSLLKATFEARRIIKRIAPDVVLGMGGFASGPGGLAAWLTRKPLIIQEQNAVAGLTNRVLAWLAKRTLAGFPNTFSKIHHHVILTGNPIRQEIADIAAPEQRMAERNGPIRLLVLGGSQGATKINEVVPNALSILHSDERPLVWHQTGRNDIEKVRRAYQLLGLKAQLDTFISNMAEAYEWADIVLCRAGALTISELAAAGLGSILIPYPHSIDNHQIKNAEYLAVAKAAVIQLQTDFSSARLAELLRKLLRNRNRQPLLQMAIAARALCHADATQKVVENCLAVIKTKDVPEPKNVPEPETITLEQKNTDEKITQEK